MKTTHKKTTCALLAASLWLAANSLAAQSHQAATSPVLSPENIVYQYAVSTTYSVPKFDAPPDIPVGSLFQPQTATAYLWIPPECRQVRGVVILGDNVPEQWLAGHPAIRQACAEENLAIVFTSPTFLLGATLSADKRILNEEQKAKSHIEFFQRILDDLAGKSGYPELRTVPWLPIGESMHLQMVTLLTQFAPERAIAGIWVQDSFVAQARTLVPMLGIQGTAADWEFQNFDLFEQWRLMATGAMKGCVAKRTSLPDCPVSLLVEAGSAHFSCTEVMIQLIARYIREACKVRLSPDGSQTLRPVDLNSGYVAGLPVPSSTPVKPKSYSSCTPAERNLPWYFTREFAQSAYDLADVNWNAQTQVPVFLDDAGKVIPFNQRGITDLKPSTEADGITFTVKATYLDKVPADFKFKAGSPLTHALGTPEVGWLRGPVIPLGNNRFQIAPNRSSGCDIRPILRTISPVDANYHLSIRPGAVTIPTNVAGKPQTIIFDPIPDQPASAKEVTLHATSDSGLPVRFYVKLGPAVVHGDKLVLTPIPAKSKMPVEVTVVAWQFGRATDPAIQTAPLVEHTFQITN
jgi:hypothetical protein